MANNVLQYVINDPIELSLSYIPFLKEGGLYIPTAEHYALGDDVSVELVLATKKITINFAGKVVWVTPKNALHHVLPGIGVQFSGANAASIRAQVESNLDKKFDIGGYTYGIMDEKTVK